MARKQLKDEHVYKVVKANELVKARFNLDNQEQKIMLYLISRIKPGDKEFTEYDFKIPEFRELLALKGSASGKYYGEIKDAIKKLADKSAWVDLNDGTGDEVLVRWIDKARINRKKDILRLRIDEDLKPFLIGLKERFTEYELWYVLRMRSMFSIRLYELLKCDLHMAKKKHDVIDYDVAELKKHMSAENLHRYPDFRRKALEKGIEEINEYTDLQVTYKPLNRNGQEATGSQGVLKIRLTVKIKDVMERKKLAENFAEQLTMFPALPDSERDWEDVIDENEVEKAWRINHGEFYYTYYPLRGSGA